MTIPEIKARLPMATVLAHYGLAADGRGRMRCPFHDDRNPSMHAFADSNTVRCYSGNCERSGRVIDVIDFVMYRDGCTKAEAIRRCKGLAGAAPAAVTKPRPTPSAPAEFARAAVLQRAFAYMSNAVANAPAARAYLTGRGLGPEALAGRGLEVGYVTGQMHHGKRASRELIVSLVGVGLLTPTGRVSGRSGREAYRAFAKGSACFPLRGRDGKVSGLYFRAVDDGAKGARHRFLRDRRGLYPGYPPADATRLLVCESVVDAASAVVAGVGDEGGGAWAVLALYGTNGWTADHAAAVAGLEHLAEACVLLDGDEAGRAATVAVAAKLREARPGVRVTAVELPAGEDCNSLLVAHGPEAVAHAIEERDAIGERAASAPAAESEPVTRADAEGLPPSPDRRRHASAEAVSAADALDASDPLDVGYRGRACAARVKGLRCDQADTLKVTARLRALADSARTVTVRCDLYDFRDLERAARAAAERLGVEEAAVVADLETLAAELEGYLAERRRGADGVHGDEPAAALTPERRRAADAVLVGSDPLARITELLGEAGIVGEERSRTLAWVCVLSCFTERPLHVILQGSSGSGKTRLLDVVAKSLPAERVRRFTRVTDNAFYNQAPGYYRHRAVLLEDMDGLKEDAEYAFREFQSLGRITSSVSTKDERGRITGGERATEGPISSAVCTTRGDVYEDNASRSLTVAVDESAAQTARVIAYQGARAAGRVTAAGERGAQGLLADVARVVAEATAVEVVNPYGPVVHLPAGVRKARRLHELYLAVVAMACRVNHRHRRRDGGGRLIAEAADLRAAASLLFEAIVLKVDELDGGLRLFFEATKAFARGRGRDSSFGRHDLRAAPGVIPSRSRQAVYLSRLVELEYLTRDGHANRGYRYRVVRWDDSAALRARISAELAAQIDQIEGERAEGEANENDKSTDGE